MKQCEETICFSICQVLRSFNWLLLFYMILGETRSSRSWNVCTVCTRKRTCPFTTSKSKTCEATPPQKKTKSNPSRSIRPRISGTMRRTWFQKIISRLGRTRWLRRGWVRGWVIMGRRRVPKYKASTLILSKMTTTDRRTRRRNRLRPQCGAGQQWIQGTQLLISGSKGLLRRHWRTS